jgi:hypothetical protein
MCVFVWLYACVRERESAYGRVGVCVTAFERAGVFSNSCGCVCAGSGKVLLLWDPPNRQRLLEIAAYPLRMPEVRVSIYT